MRGIMRFNGVERTLLDFRFSHDRDTDLFGIPCTYPKDSFIRLSFAAEEGDGFFLDWMCGRSESNKGYTGYWYDGEIVFYDELSDGQEFYRYDLRGVMPVHFMVYYDQHQGMLVCLTLTANERIYNRFMGAEFFFLYRFWYVEAEEKPQRMISYEPRFDGYYFEDSDGKRIEKDTLYPEQEVYLCVETTYGQGDQMTISPEDRDLDYEYEGEELKNDTLRNLSVTDKLTRVKLKTLTPKDKKQVSGKKDNTNIATARFVSGRGNTMQIHFPQVVVPEYVVNFETNPTTYQGEFGFDWFRKEWRGSDSPCTDGAEELKKLYTPFEMGVPHVNTGESYGSYYAPWLVIPPRSTVKLLLVSDMDYNNCDTPETEILRLKPERTSISVTPDELTLYDCSNGGAEITVSCSDSVISPTSITVESSNGAVVGKLNIAANAEYDYYKIKIPVVYAYMEDEPDFGESVIDAEIGKIGGLRAIEDYLNNRSLNQALIQVEFQYDKDGQPFKLGFSRKELILANDGRNIKTGGRDYNYGKFEGMWNKTTNKFDSDKITSFIHYRFGEVKPELVNLKKDIILYLTPLRAEGAGGASPMAPLYSKNSVVFRERLSHLSTYAHELGHVLGVPHTFREDYQGMIANADGNIRLCEQALRDLEPIAESDPSNERVVDAHRYLRKWTDTKEAFEKIREYDKYKFRLGSTDNFMDYNNRPKSFYIWQIRVMQRETKLYYYAKKNKI